MNCKILELFAGTASFSNEARKFGASCVTVDNDERFDTTERKDVLKMKARKYMGFNVIWASPPCQCFSTGAMGKHWTGGCRAYIPASDKTRHALKMLDHTVKLISEIKPTYWFIENPRAVMRKVINPIFQKYGITDVERRTVWYCQYGDTSAKPTDIFTNLKTWEPRPVCKNNNPDCHHERAPRGAKTGTQGKNGAAARAVIPAALCNEIIYTIRKS